MFTIQQTLRNPQNNSPSKYQFTIPKAPRFRTKSQINQYHFYDIPPNKTITHTFIKNKSRTNTLPNNNNPSPTHYHLPDDSNKLSKGISFGVSRQCLKNSIFIMNANPGPGHYQPNPQITEKKITLNYSLRKKTSLCAPNNQSPGPAMYNVQTPLIYQQLFLSTTKKQKCPKITQPSTKIKTPQISNHTLYMPTLTYKGFKLPFNKQGFSIPKCKRFELKKKEEVPGPGYYDQFSQFIHGKKSE